MDLVARLSRRKRFTAAITVTHHAALVAVVEPAGKAKKLYGRNYCYTPCGTGGCGSRPCGAVPARDIRASGGGFYHLDLADEEVVQELHVTNTSA